MARISKPVIRDDGKWYQSAYSAAKDLVQNELGGVGDVINITHQISKVCNHYRGLKSCHGRQFEFAESPVVHVLLVRICKMQETVDSLEDRLDKANDELRLNGLSEF